MPSFQANRSARGASSLVTAVSHAVSHAVGKETPRVSFVSLKRTVLLFRSLHLTCSSLLVSSFSSHKSPEAEARAKQQQKKLAALTKRKQQERQAVALNSCPPANTLKQAKKAKTASSSVSKVLKPHATPGAATKTPTRAEKPPRSVTPAVPSVRVRPPSVINTGTDVQDDDDTVESSTFANSFFPQGESFEGILQGKDTLEQEDDTVPQDDDDASTVQEDTMAPNKNKKTNDKGKADISVYALKQLKKKLEDLKEDNDLLNSQLAHQGKELSDVSGQYDLLQLEVKKAAKRSNCDSVSIRDYNAVKSDLMKAQKEVQKYQKLYGTLEEKYEAKKKLVAALQKKVNELEENADADGGVEPAPEVKDLMEALSKAQKENLGLKHCIDKLNKIVSECLGELKKKGKALKCEMAKEVVGPAKDALKEVVYRTTKLVNSKKDEELKAMMQQIYDEIKEERGFEDEDSPDDYCTFDDFHRIYKDELMKYFNQIRQQTQTACQSAVLGTCNCHAELQ